MACWQRRECVWGAVVCTLAMSCQWSWAQQDAPTDAETAEPAATESAAGSPAAGSPGAGSPGLADLDEALRVRINAQGLRDLNRVISLVETALDKGLNEDNQAFAQNMLADALMDRATSLIQVMNMQPLQSQQMQQIRQLVTSDLRRVLQSEEPPSEASLMLGRLQALPDGDPYEARRVLQDYLEHDDLPPAKRAEALVLRGRLVKDQTKALADFDEAIALVPEDENYRLARALLLRSQGQLEAALTTVGEILERNPDVANALLLQGELYRQLNRSEEALASFDAASELVPQAPGPYQNRGEIYRSQGKFEQAVAQFSKVLELKPGVLLTLVHRAEAYLNAGQPELALADIEIVLEKQSLIAAHRIRADALSKLGRLDEAIDEMERLAAAIPNEGGLRMQLALYYLVDKQPRKAVAAYSEILEIDDQNVEALRSRGDAYLNIGKHQEAIVDFERVLELQPEDTSVLNNLAWVLATSPEDQLRDGSRAITLATKACELTKYRRPHILSTLAAAYAEAGDFKSAQEWSQKSVDMDDPEHREQLARELQSYQDGKPWREKQIMAENPKAAEPPSDTPPTESPPAIERHIEQELDFQPEPLVD